MRVLIGYHHALVASLLAEALQLRGFEAITSSIDASGDLLRKVRHFEPAVVLLEVRPERDPDTVTLVSRLRRAGARIVLLSGTTQPLPLAEYVEAGAMDIVSKAAPLDRLVRIVTAAAASPSHSGLPPTLRDALQRILQEHRHRAAPFDSLTRGESDVLAALLDGKNAQTIALETFRAVRTVRGHIHGILSKLRVNSQLAAIAKAKAVGWPPRHTESDRES